MAQGHYLVLARKWRPATFEDVVGQEHITRTLQNAIRAGRVPHAFLFIGSRGIGKTTSARILAKALNCLSVDAPTPSPCGTCDNCVTIASGTNIDVMEIDGASNNSVDDVRQIRENIRMVPANSRYKIYVIDEVHQLSSSAFNALLKTLEEPPPHAIFVLATTEAHKIPATIVSRCQRYDFRRVSLPELTKLLRSILDAESVTCSDAALHAIARAADGGVRDAESILDQLMSYCGKEITFQDVFDVLGLVDWRVLHDLSDGIVEQDVTRLLKIVENVVICGKDLGQFVQEILRFFRNLLVCKSGAPTELLALPDEEVVEMQRAAEKFSLMELIRLVEQFAELTRGFDSQLAQRTALEALLIRISARSVDVSLDSVLEKIARLRNGGGPSGEEPVASRSATPEAVKEKPKSERSSRREVTDAETAALWDAIVERAKVRSINFATWLAHGRPVGIDGESLVIEFDTDQQMSRSIVERDENRMFINEALGELTVNLTGFRTSAAQKAADTVVTEPALPISPKVDRELGRQALDNPLVRSILDTFRGQIVDVRPGTEPSG